MKKHAMCPTLILIGCKDLAWGVGISCIYVYIYMFHKMISVVGSWKIHRLYNKFFESKIGLWTTELTTKQ